MSDIDTEMCATKGAFYRPLVHKIFSDTRTLVLGAFASTVGIALTAISTHSPVLYACTIAMLIVGVGRLLVNRAYLGASTSGTIGDADLYRWELRYTVGAVAATLIFGIWCFYSMAILGDSFASFASCTITFANLIGVAGRNFPIARLMNAQTALAGGGIFLGVFFMGGYYMPLSLLVFAFMVSIRKLGGAQRKTLFSALIERKKAEKLATQFTTTLNNVPEAILMFDSSRKLEVANNLALRVLDSTTEALDQMRLEDLLNILVRKNRLSEMDAANIARILYNDQRPSGFTFKTGANATRTVKMRANPMENGGVVATFEDITEEVEAKSTIDHMAKFDQLTGLVNRDQLQRMLSQELVQRAADEQCSVLLINIDRFKQVNEALGHRVGDLLLCEATKRISAIVGDSGLCSRYGGDEFAVVLRKAGDQDLAQALADNIIDAMTKPMIIEQKTVELTCSIGMSFGARSDDTAEALLKQADMALFWAKQDGRGEWRVFTRKMSKELEERRKLEKDLRLAVKNGELETFFQPLVSVSERQVTTCEALLRWNHPEKGMISPAVFIPLAEETGVIEEMGAWVLDDACRACASWPKETRVAVNLSAVQFSQGDIVQTVGEALSKSGLDPKRLELEITESLMLSNLDETIERLNQFIAMGVRISLDDFGTGYSSLSYMNDLPLDKVKIDRSFVNDLKEGSKSLTLVQAICALGQELGLSVVVEGVETAEQLEALLRNSSVTEIQGYYFSKPLGYDELAEILDHSTVASSKMLEKMPNQQNIAA